MSKSKHSKHSKQLTKEVGQVLDIMAKSDPIVTDTPVTDTPVTDTPVTDTPVTDTPVTIPVTTHYSNGQPDMHTAEDSQGNLVLTPEDLARLETVKALQATALQAKIDAKEAIAKAQEAIQALNGSEAIKAIKQDIEARLASQEAIVTELTAKRDIELDKLRDIQAEYQSLTGINTKIKASKGKASGNGHGKIFDTRPITIDDDGSIRILVNHIPTANVFEYSLYPVNGSIVKDQWLKLRHAFVALMESKASLNERDCAPYLSNLKTQIEKIKAIA